MYGTYASCTCIHVYIYIYIYIPPTLGSPPKNILGRLRGPSAGAYEQVTELKFVGEGTNRNPVIFTINCWMFGTSPCNDGRVLGGDWNMNRLIFQKHEWISLSQLTKSNLFQRGRYTTNQMVVFGFLQLGTWVYDIYWTWVHGRAELFRLWCILTDRSEFVAHARHRSLVVWFWNCFDSL